MEKWQRVTIILALVLLLVGGLNLTIRAIQQTQGEEKRFFALNLESREIVVCGHPYRVGALLDQGRNSMARCLEGFSLSNLKQVLK